MCFYNLRENTVLSNTNVPVENFQIYILTDCLSEMFLCSIENVVMTAYLNICAWFSDTNILTMFHFMILKTNSLCG